LRFVAFQKYQHAKSKYDFQFTAVGNGLMYSQVNFPTIEE